MILLRRTTSFLGVSDCERDRSCGVSYIEMATGTRNVFAAMDTENRVCEFRMTGFASALSNPVIVAFDLDIVRKAAGRECEGMEKTIGRFDRILSDELVRRVTVIACRDSTVTALDPCSVIVLHHMAIGACGRIIGEVGIPFRVYEGINT